ncbi:hypothetical protein V8E52_011069 [Russula decolorans]
MVGTFQSTASQFAGGIFQVTSQHIGQCLVESTRKQFPRQKTQRGDFYVDLTYHILDANLSLIKPRDKRTIQIMIEKVMEKREISEMEGDTRLERFLKAKQFKELSKALYVVTKASDRGKGESLLAQIKQATGATGQTTPELNNRDPFSDPPSVQLFTDSPTDTLERVEVTTLQSGTTGDAAVHLTLHGQGVPTQDVVATFSPEVFANDWVD